MPDQPRSNSSKPFGLAAPAGCSRLTEDAGQRADQALRDSAPRQDGRLVAQAGTCHSGSWPGMPITTRRLVSVACSGTILPSFDGIAIADGSVWSQTCPAGLRPRWCAVSGASDGYLA